MLTQGTDNPIKPQLLTYRFAFPYNRQESRYTFQPASTFWILSLTQTYWLALSVSRQLLLLHLLLYCPRHILKLLSSHAKHLNGIYGQGEACCFLCLVSCCPHLSQVKWYWNPSCVPSLSFLSAFLQTTTQRGDIWQSTQACHCTTRRPSIPLPLLHIDVCS